MLRLLAAGSAVAAAIFTFIPTAADDGPATESQYAGLEPGTVKTVAGNGKGLTAEQRSTRGGSTLADDPPQRPLDVGADGTLYIAQPDLNQVISVMPDGDAKVFAGTGDRGSQGDGGPAALASIDSPRDVAVGKNGELYIATFAGVRKVDSNGVIDTVENDAIRAPVSVAVSKDGELYVGNDADPNSTTGSTIVRITKGKATTIAGGGDGDPDSNKATDAELYTVRDIAVDSVGTVYFTQGWRDRTFPIVYEVTTRGDLRVAAGSGDATDDETPGYGGDGGPANKAKLNNPEDLAVGHDGSLYIADSHNGRIRKVDGEGKITTVAETGREADYVDGEHEKKADVNAPRTIAAGPDGTIYLVSYDGVLVRKIKDNRVSTAVDLVAAESAVTYRDGQQATDALIDLPSSVAVDSDGSILVVHGGPHLGVLRRIGPDGRISSPMAKAETPVGRTGTSVVATGPEGEVYLAISTPDNAVIKIDPDGAVSTVAGNSEPASPETPRSGGEAGLAQVVDLAVSRQGAVFIATKQEVLRLAENGAPVTAYKSANPDPRDYLGGIAGIDVDQRGFLHVVDSRRVFRVGGGVPTPIAGVADPGDAVDLGDREGADATEVDLSPYDVAVARDGSIYISDSGYIDQRRSTRSAIRRVDPDGTMTTVATVPLGDNRSVSITSLAMSPGGDLYFANPGGKTVQVLVQPGLVETPADWSWVWWIVGGLGVAFAVFLVGWHWRLRRRKPGAPMSYPAPPQHPQGRW